MAASFVAEDHYVDLAAGRFASTSAADLDRIFRGIATSGVGTLVVHFHGGLNSRAEGIQRVSDLGPTYASAGAYPLFFVWESWVSEVISNGFVEIFDEPIFKAAVDRVQAVVMRKIASSQATRGGRPETDAERALRDEVDKARADAGHEPRVPDELRERVFATAEHEERDLLDEFVSHPVISSEARAIVHHLLPDVAERALRGGLIKSLETRATRLRADVVNGLKAAADSPAIAIAPALVEITVKVCSRYAQGRDHGLVATVVEEVLRRLYFVEGWFSWMKEQIDDAFLPDPLQRGGTALLAHLKGMRDAGKALRVVLVGHSAGSIYCCSTIENARAVVPEQKFDVVLLAPAVTFERFGRTLATNGAAIDRLHNVALCDTLERKDRWLPRATEAYPASLLYFTSGVMERDAATSGDVPVVGMQRFYEDSVPLAAGERSALDYLGAPEEKLCWAGAAAPPALHLTDPITVQHHSGFAEEASVRALVGRFIA